MTTTDETANDAQQTQAPDTGATGNVDIQEAFDSVTPEKSEAAVEQAYEAEDDWLKANDSSEDELGVTAEESGAAEETGDADADTAETTEHTETTQREPELADAYAALRRDGWDPEDLDTLDPKRVLAMAEKRIKVQGDTDRAFQELKELKAKETNDGDSAESGAVADTAEATPDSPAQDISKMVAPLAEALALDEEGTKTLVEFQKSTMAPLVKGFEAQSAFIAQMANDLTGMKVEATRVQMVDRFPQLQDASSDATKAVYARMADLDKSGEYDSIPALMEAAAAIALAPQARADVARARETVNQLQSNGQPSTHATPAPEQLAGMSTEEREDATLAMLESGDPNARAKAGAMWDR